MPVRSHPPISFVLEVGDVVYLAGELGEIEFYGEVRRLDGG